MGISGRAVEHPTVNRGGGGTVVQSHLPPFQNLDNLLHLMLQTYVFLKRH